MRFFVCDNSKDLGKEAAKSGALKINQAISEKGFANVILATGASQFDTLEALVKEDVDWSKVTCFHLDEYVGISVNHKASFRKYLKERFEDKVKNLKAFNYVNGDAPDLDKELDRIGSLIKAVDIDVAFIGIGENGHLAFNDPPADFETEVPYLVVDLDEKCRNQQVGEGWFNTMDEVPKQAVSMSIRQIMKSKTIICAVPDSRKSDAVNMAINNELSNLYPCTIMREHKDSYLITEYASAAKVLGK